MISKGSSLGKHLDFGTRVEAHQKKVKIAIKNKKTLTRHPPRPLPTSKCAIPFKNQFNLKSVITTRTINLRPQSRMKTDLPKKDAILEMLQKSDNHLAVLDS